MTDFQQFWKLLHRYRVESLMLVFNGHRRSGWAWYWCGAEGNGVTKSIKCHLLGKNLNSQIFCSYSVYLCCGIMLPVVWMGCWVEEISSSLHFTQQPLHQRSYLLKSLCIPPRLEEAAMVKEMWQYNTALGVGLFTIMNFRVFTLWKPVGHNESAQKAKRWNDFAAGQKGRVIPHPQL